MEHQLAPPRPVERPRVRLGAVLAVALGAALAAWILLEGGRTENSQAPAAPSAIGPRASTPDGLSAIAALRRSPVYWAGPRGGVVYEVTETTDGYVFVRYLPRGAEVGTPRHLLTVATYPRGDAYGDVQAAARRPGAVAVTLGGGGLAVYDERKPTSVYVAYPGAHEQVEIYDPAASEALRLAQSELVTPVP